MDTRFSFLRYHNPIPSNPQVKLVPLQGSCERDWTLWPLASIAKGQSNWLIFLGTSQKKNKISNTSISEFNSVYLRKILTSLTPLHLDYFSFIFLIIEVVALYVCCLFIKFLWLNAAREEMDMFRLEIQSWPAYCSPHWEAMLELPSSVPWALHEVMLSSQGTPSYLRVVPKK